MKIHEYQGKEILRKYGVPTPIGFPILNLDEADSVLERLVKETKSEVVVVKAQIHAGGRGKGGGVKVAKTKSDARALIRQIYGMQLVTHQTGPAGQKVGRLLLEQGLDIERELYLGMTLDRERGCVTVMASTEGGMDIEEVATKTPEKILKQPIHPEIGWQPFQARELAFGLHLQDKQIKSFERFLSALVTCYFDMDCSLAEINPLVVTKQGDVLALDAKINFDDNALFRHPSLEELRDPSEEDPSETEAKRYDLSFISLDGNIGCMVNGAGLAMATMDIIKHFGGEPANFLDVGGGATTQKVTAAFKIITQDPSVKGIFVNIFGGIMKCDTIAEGVVAAAKELGLNVPLVVRLEGTNVEQGRTIIEKSGLNVIPAKDMADGAAKIVELAKAKANAQRNKS